MSKKCNNTKIIQNCIDKDMKFMIFIILVAFITTPYAFATSLENTELNARSGVITLDIEFGHDKIKHGLFSTIGVA